MGAWLIYYQLTKPLMKGNNDVLGYAIRGIKRELAYNDFHDGLNLDTQAFGTSADKNTRLFQRANGLEDDGVVGPHTGLALFRKRCMDLENQYAIPNGYLRKIKTVESSNDPGATGNVDPADTGLVMIHLSPQISITLEQAVEPAWCLPYCARTLAARHERLVNWPATIASWNVGEGGAAYWNRAGRPKTLFADWFTDPDGNLIDLGARATHYVDLVRAAAD